MRLRAKSTDADGRGCENTDHNQGISGLNFGWAPVSTPFRNTAAPLPDRPEHDGNSPASNPLASWQLDQLSSSQQPYFAQQLLQLSGNRQSASGRYTAQRIAASGGMAIPEPVRVRVPS